MTDNRKIIFNHIPKTGGITLRIILDKVYGSSAIFTLKSTDIGSSIRLFDHLSEEERNAFKVIAGHGAELLSHHFENPFRITILREPVSLFLSQYHFLKISDGTDFYEDVRKMQGLEDYLEYAIEKGQDNLMTRYLSNSIGFLTGTSQPVPTMETDGQGLLDEAMKNLDGYDAVIDLGEFDAAIFSLSKALGWKRVPIYRPSNRNRKNPGRKVLSASMEDELRRVLRFDIALHEYFTGKRMSLGMDIERTGAAWRLFSLRQQGIRLAANILGKR